MQRRGIHGGGSVCVLSVRVASPMTALGRGFTDVAALTKDKEDTSRSTNLQADRKVKKLTDFTHTKITLQISSISDEIYVHLLFVYSQFLYNFCVKIDFP